MKQLFTTLLLAMSFMALAQKPVIAYTAEQDRVEVDVKERCLRVFLYDNDNDSPNISIELDNIERHGNEVIATSNHIPCIAAYIKGKEAWFCGILLKNWGFQ